MHAMTRQEYLDRDEREVYGETARECDARHVREDAEKAAADKEDAEWSALHDKAIALIDSDAFLDVIVSDPEGKQKLLSLLRNAFDTAAWPCTMGWRGQYDQCRTFGDWAKSLAWKKAEGL